MSLGDSLKHARINKNLTQESVAKILFVTRQTVSRWEQNKTLPNIYVLKDLSSLYGLSLDELISETKAQIKHNEEIRPMNKINWFALFGVIAFNIVLFSSGAIIVVAMLGALWVITAAFIISPLLLLIGLITGTQIYPILSTLLCALIFIVGLGLYPIAKRATHYLVTFFVGYVKYNRRTIYK